MTQAFHARLVRGLILIVTVAGLAACGGSSGTPPATSPPPPPSAPPPPPPPPPSGFDTQEFDDSNGLDNINAKPAFEAGGSGEGIVVGIVDSGIDADHLEFRGRISPASKDVTLDRSTPTIEDEDGHGTLVAGIIGANRNNLGVMGVAFNSTLLIARADSPKSCANDKDGCSFAERDIAAGIRLAVANGARVVNISLGGDGFGFALLDAVREAAAADVLVIIAAGNDSAADPSGFAQVALDPAVQGHVLVVGATTQFDTLAGFSDMAGILQDAFLVAPGQSVRSTFINNQLAIASGTSFAAPFVTGAVAVMAQLFPNLTGSEIAEILLGTARDLGDPGPDPVFGQGLLDLGKAVAPIGTTAVPTSADGTTAAPVAGASAATGAAFGDAIARTDVFDGILMIDRYRRSYRVDLGGNIVAAPAGFSLRRLVDRVHRLPGAELSVGGRARFSFSAYEDDIRGLLPSLDNYARSRATRARPLAFFSGRLDEKSDLSLAYGFSPARLLGAAAQRDAARDFALSERIDTPLLGFADAGETLVLTRRLSPRWNAALALTRSDDRSDPFRTLRLRSPGTQTTTAVAQLATRLGRTAFTMQLGSRVERGSVLDTRASGALALGKGARSDFLALDADLALGRHWSLFGRSVQAVTRIAGAGADLLARPAHFRSESLAAGIRGRGLFHRRDHLGLAFVQPLRVSSGGATVRVPVDRDYAADRFLFEDRRLDLSPTGRERDIEFSYGFPLSDRIDVDANFVQQFEPGHVRDARSIRSLVLRLRTRF